MTGEPQKVLSAAPQTLENIAERCSFCGWSLNEARWRYVWNPEQSEVHAQVTDILFNF